LKSLQVQDRSSVRHGDFPITDSLIDDCGKILREEWNDVSGFVKGVAIARAAFGRRRGSGTGTHAAASSVGTHPVAGAMADAVAASMVSRKRSYSVANEEDAAARKSRKGPKGARVLMNHLQPSRALPASNCCGYSSDQKLSVAANSSQGLQKWQIDKLMDWMKDNDYSSSPDWVAIDELVESTGMKPSQIVACTAELGGRIAMLRNVGLDAGVTKEVICIDEDEDSVPELADDTDDDRDGLIANDVTGQAALKTRSMEQEETEAHLFEAENSFLESLVLEFEFDFGSSSSSHSLQAGQSIQNLDARCEMSLTDFEEDELYADLLSPLDDDGVNECQGHLGIPSNRVRSDSLESLFALLD
jgi:hypothetical protein